MASATVDSMTSVGLGIGIPEFLSQILLRTVREHRHHYTAGKPFGDLECCGEGRPRRNPAQKSFLAGKASHHLISTLALDAQVFVRNRRIVDTWDNCGVHVLQPLEAMKRPAWLERNQLDRRIELSQTTTSADNCAARAQ